MGLAKSGGNEGDILRGSVGGERTDGELVVQIDRIAASIADWCDATIFTEAGIGVPDLDFIAFPTYE